MKDGTTNLEKALDTYIRITEPEQDLILELLNVGS
jgi:hypothetical protein